MLKAVYQAIKRSLKLRSQKQKMKTLNELLKEAQRLKLDQSLSNPSRTRTSVLQVLEPLVSGRECNSMPLVRLGLTICVVKCSYFLVWHCVSKITLLFCLGGSRQSLKVEVHPRRPRYYLFKDPCCYWRNVTIIRSVLIL